MKRLLTMAVLALSLNARAQTNQETEIPVSIVMQFQQGHYAIPDEYAARRLTKDPNDRAALGLQGMLHATRGHFAAALPLFEAAAGTDFYEQYALRHHANALRAAGNPEAAASLREQRLVKAGLGENHFNLDLLDLSEDYRQLGDYDRAMEYAEMAMGLYPDRPTSFAIQAQIAMDQGDLDLASELLWTGRLYGVDRITRQLVAEGRLLVLQGSPQGALNLLQPWRRKLPRDIGFWALLAECHTAVGDLDAAEHILYGMIRFTEFAHPEQIVARAHYQLARGDRAAAEALVLDALAELPGNPHLRAAADEFGL